MRPFIQAKGDMPGNVNFSAAYWGFAEMGFECVLFRSIEELDASSRGDVVVGGLGPVRHALVSRGVRIEEFDYPDELRGYMGRRTWSSAMDEVAADCSMRRVFVKPVEDKRFTGKTVACIGDLTGLGTSGYNPPVSCSEVVDFRAEWRCFVRYGDILDVRPYKGDWRLSFDLAVIEGAVAAYETAPAGYAADFGVTHDGRTLLVEVNDGYSLGCYGLQHNLYAQLLAARWAELTETPDECDFR